MESLVGVRRAAINRGSMRSHVVVVLFVSLSVLSMVTESVVGNDGGVSRSEDSTGPRRQGTESELGDGQ